MWYTNVSTYLQIFATVLAVAAAIPLEDTEEVKAAKAEFAKAFAAAEAGEHAALRPAPVATAYLAEEPEVAEATAAFMKVFDAYKAGEIPLPVAPVHEVAPVCILFSNHQKLFNFVNPSCGISRGGTQN